jgi:hypothetical protein
VEIRLPSLYTVEHRTAVTNPVVVVVGIPIPSTSKLFLSVVAVHVLVGLGAVAGGLVAMLSVKGSGRHGFAGTVYYWCLALVCGSMAILSVMRWPEDNHLLMLGMLSFAAGATGRAARRGQWRHWLQVYITGMGVSYRVVDGVLCRQRAASSTLARVAGDGLLGCSRLGWTADHGLHTPAPSACETAEPANFPLKTLNAWYQERRSIATGMSHGSCTQVRRGGMLASWCGSQHPQRRDGSTRFSPGINGMVGEWASGSLVSNPREFARATQGSPVKVSKALSGHAPKTRPDPSGPSVSRRP